MRARLLIVVSGLAASGKSTVGRALSGGLSLPLIDKDEILEALFDTLGCDDRDQRYRLSRASDEVLFRLAASSDAAVLVNWWDHDNAPDRLRSISDAVVEVFCDCPIELAAARLRPATVTLGTSTISGQPRRTKRGSAGCASPTEDLSVRANRW